jgi:hypothetical protein
MRYQLYVTDVRFAYLSVSTESIGHWRFREEIGVHHESSA